jgi:hypothetical protein
MNNTMCLGAAPARLAKPRAQPAVRVRACDTPSTYICRAACPPALAIAFVHESVDASRGVSDRFRLCRDLPCTRQHPWPSLDLLGGGMAVTTYNTCNDSAAIDVPSLQPTLSNQHHVGIRLLPSFTLEVLALRRSTWWRAGGRGVAWRACGRVGARVGVRACWRVCDSSYVRELIRA